MNEETLTRFFSRVFEHKRKRSGMSITSSPLKAVCGDDMASSIDTTSPNDSSGNITILQSVESDLGISWGLPVARRKEFLGNLRQRSERRMQSEDVACVSDKTPDEADAFETIFHLAVLVMIIGSIAYLFLFGVQRFEIEQSEDLVNTSQAECYMRAAQ